MRPRRGWTKSCRASATASTGLGFPWRESARGQRPEALRRRGIDETGRGGRISLDISDAGGNVWAVLVAAGRGERFGAGRPKAFVKLGDRVLLAESLERLEASDWIDSIVVVGPVGWEEPTILLAEELGCGKVTATVSGGASRTDSVRAGVEAVPDGAAVVLVHDAARPLLTDAVIERVLAPLGEGFDGAVPAVPLADTVKRVDRGVVAETLDRSQLVGAQTPQAFVSSVLRSALKGDVGAATDCAALVEARGGRVRVVDGDRRLLKVTTQEDLELVASWL